MLPARRINGNPSGAVIDNLKRMLPNIRQPAAGMCDPEAGRARARRPASARA